MGIYYINGALLILNFSETTSGLTSNALYLLKLREFEKGLHKYLVKDTTGIASNGDYSDFGALTYTTYEWALILIESRANSESGA